MTSLKFHGIKPYKSSIWFIPIGLTYEKDTMLSPVYTNYIFIIGILCFGIKISFSIWRDKK